ncbi:TRAPP II complex [Chlamydoabsidia padenii]|nr:TRAPP II complex [Chlamydoabsidia padenii]
MELDTNLTGSCQISVLLVPIYPIKRSVFTRYLELIRQFTIIRLNDVTPDNTSDHAAFNSQNFQEGQVHFNFSTHYSGDHRDLVDFQPHRRLFGVIGIMDCQEWKGQDLKKGYQQFIDSLEKYPSPIVTRCFGFDPTENQPDDTKGLIMIPDVGDMTFYMATLISDFTSQILTQFSILAKHIGQQFKSDLPGTRNTNYASPPPASQQQAAPQQLSNRPDTPSSSVGYASRDKKRAPGRIKKLYADFYLLSGQLPDAITLYLQAIDMTKITSDYLWLASAIEGYVCTTLLLEQLYGNQATKKSPILSDTTTTDSPLDKEDTHLSRSPLTVSFVLEQYNFVLHYYAKEFNSTTTYKPMDDVPNNDGYVANMTGSASISCLLYAEACLKMARFLLTVYLNGKLDNHALFLLMHGVTTSSLAPSSSLPATPISMTYSQQTPGTNEIERWDIGVWTTRVWEASVSNLTVIDQIHLMSQMTFIYNSIGYYRKAAWMKYQSIQLMLPILLHRRAKSTLSTNYMNSCKPLTTMNSHGILKILKWICKVYGIEDPDMDVDSSTIGQQVDFYITKFGKETTNRWPSLQLAVLRKCIITAESLHAYTDMLYYTTTLLRNMYPYILKEEQIRLANTIQRISTIQKRAAATNETDLEDNNPNYWGVNIITRITAIQSIPRKQLHQHPLGKTMILNAISGMSPSHQETDSSFNHSESNSSDPFIYNPFIQKKSEKEQHLLTRNEVADFQVTLTNPFGFDLELQNIQLCTSGVSFQASHHSAAVPAFGTTNLRLSGMPQEIGTLCIRGCVIKIVGFAEQEFLVNQDEDTSDSQGNLPTLDQHEFMVVAEEPLVKIKSTSLIQGAIMLFEGERTQIELTLENIGNVPVDFIALSFTNNSLAINGPSGAFTNLSMEQQYEIERINADTKVFMWHGNIKHGDQTIGDQVWFPPDSTLDLTLDIYGQRGSTHGTIQVDYGYLNNDNDNQQVPVIDTFYTRQLYIPVLITVHCHLKPQNWDILSVKLEDIPRHDDGSYAAASSQNDGSNDISTEKVLELLAQAIEHMNSGNLYEQNKYCLATIDIQNRWSFPFKVLFTINNQDDDSSNGTDSIMHVDTTIPPGTTSRMILPIKRLHLSHKETSQPITLETRKQFVVTQQESQENYLKWQLCLFWYREQLLRRMKATWITNSSNITNRQGDLDLRSIVRVTMDQLDHLKVSDVVFDVALKGDGVIRSGARHYTCQVDQPVLMTITVINQHLERSTKFILRVQSKETGQQTLLMQGMNQVILPELPLHQQAQHKIPVYFLAQGRYDFLYHAQDMISKSIYYDHDGITIDVVN